jgi:hypothetical protein
MAILTSNYGCDAHRHFKDSENARSTIPNDAQIIPPNLNPKPASHMATILNPKL